MHIETFTVGALSTNCYVVSSLHPKEAIIIDPGIELTLEADQVFDYIKGADLKVKLIVNTHGHSDHVCGDAIFQEKYNVAICIHRLDAGSVAVLENVNFPPTLQVDEGGLISFGNESLKVLHTPGHTPGSICLLGERLVFTGDTLFAGGIGRTDFPGGSDSNMQQSLRKLQLLPDYFVIYPGHGPTSIMGEEKRVNPFL